MVCKLPVHTDYRRHSTAGLLVCAAEAVALHHCGKHSTVTTAQLEHNPQLSPACRDSWEHEGPMVPNLDAMDASDRLRKFKQTFEVNKGKWDNYSSGEELFGLAVTKYPELEDIQVRGAGVWR